MTKSDAAKILAMPVPPKRDKETRQISDEWRWLRNKRKKARRVLDRV